MKGFGIYVKNDLLEPKHYQNMGESIWLYLWLLDKITSISEAGVGKVLGGRPVTTEDIQVELGLPIRTYRRYTARLKQYGYISITRAPHGLIFTVSKASKPFKRSAKSGTSDRPKVAHEKAKKANSDVPNMYSDVPNSVVPSANVAHVNKEMTKTIQDNTISTTNVVLAKDEIGILFYQAIKSLKLPILNHNTIKTKIKQLQTEDTTSVIIDYLTFMRDQFASLNIEYKPHINNALDLYSKRKQIENIMKKTATDQSKPTVWRAT